MGVASIVLIVAMGDGFKDGQRDRFRQLGENIVIVFNGRTEKQVGGRRAGRSIRMDYQDVRDIRAECWLVSRAVAELQNQARAVSSYNSGTFSVFGVEPLYAQMRTIPVERGRFLAEQDNLEATRVAILGDNVRKQLYGEHAVAPGDRVAINGIPFRIVGLMPLKRRTAPIMAWTATRSSCPTPPWCRTCRLPIRTSALDSSTTSSMCRPPSNSGRRRGTRWSAY